MPSKSNLLVHFSLWMVLVVYSIVGPCIQHPLLLHTSFRSAFRHILTPPPWRLPKEQAPKPLFASGILHSSVITTVLLLDSTYAFQHYQPWLIYINRNKTNSGIALMLNQKAFKSIFCWSISWAKSEGYFGFTHVLMFTVLLCYFKYEVI